MSDARYVKITKFSMSVTSSAHQGCYLANPDDSWRYPNWCFGASSHDYGFDDAPEIAIDPDDGTLSFINTGSLPKTYFVTIENAVSVLDSVGADLLSKSWSTTGRNYITFVSTVRPREMVSVARIVPERSRRRIRARDFESIKISSDIQEYVASETIEHVVDIEMFPLVSSSSEGFLCTQSVGGTLTHFAHPSTFFAVDFRCPIGTPVVAVFDAQIIEIRNETDESGVHVHHLFHWNSIMIKHIGSDTYAEYVHVKKDSFKVTVGEKVAIGQVLCLSGDAGFCPEPHLHFELHSSREPGNPSIPITYKGERFVVDQFYS